MKIQSLSVVVPNKKCMNSCKFCVSKMHCDDYKNQMDDNLPFFDLYMTDYLKRLEFARSNGCNTVMLTGTSEPQQNRKFLTYFGMFMKMMKNPFQWIEMQTTGAGLDKNYLRFLRNHVGVSVISLSISALDDQMNNRIIGTPDSMQVDLRSLCEDIKLYDFSLRLSLNLTDYFDRYDGVELGPEHLFIYAKEVLKADQVTLRVLYSSGENTPQDKWIENNKASVDAVRSIMDFIQKEGKVLSTLPYGAKKYSVNGMSVVIDTDCMAKDESIREQDEVYKYLVLRPDCKLYSTWDDPASLIF